jgi:hypothetical protein
MQSKSCKLFSLRITLLSSLLSLISMPAGADSKDWSGPYIGVNVGGKVADANWKTTFIQVADTPSSV